MLTGLIWNKNYWNFKIENRF